MSDTSSPAIEIPQIRKASFAADLARFGPGFDGSVSLADARAYTRSLARSHYENFPVLTCLLPRAMRQPIADVYAFSRWADDLSDEVEGAAESLELLDWWRSLLHDCYAGHARHPVFVALRDSIETHDLPRGCFDDLVDAFVQDQTVSRYDSMPQLVDYARRSANPVGRLVLAIGGQASDENVALSDTICTGLQLANFWQDVRRDAGIGRRYLPADRMAPFDVTDAMVGATATSPQLASLLASLVEETVAMLDAGRPLARRLPLRLGLVIDLFRRGGLAICRRIVEQNYRVLESRPRVTKGDAARELAAAIAGRLRPRSPKSVVN